MPEYGSDKPGCFLRQTLIGCFAIVIGIVLCSIASVVGIDVTCRGDIEHALPLYPNAEIVSETHDFFRVRAMGKSLVVLSTSDLPVDVRKWYSDYRRSLTQHESDESSGRNLPTNGLASVSYQVEQDSATGKTLISLASECAYN